MLTSAVADHRRYGGVLPRPSLKLIRRSAKRRGVIRYGGVLPRPSLKHATGTSTHAAPDQLRRGSSPPLIEAGLP